MNDGYYVRRVEELRGLLQVHAERETRLRHRIDTLLDERAALQKELRRVRRLLRAEQPDIVRHLAALQRVRTRLRRRTEQVYQLRISRDLWRTRASQTHEMHNATTRERYSR